jgi:hypothetical protein
MTNDTYYDFMFGSIDFLSVEPHPREAREFYKFATSSLLPDEYTFETPSAIIKINKEKLEFRILKRKYYSEDSVKNGFPSKLEVDMEIIIAYKIAKMAGFDVFLEPKYMN